MEGVKKECKVMLYCAQAMASCKVSGPYEVSHITSNNSDFYKKKYVIVFKEYLFSIFLLAKKLHFIQYYTFWNHKRE